jgi:hypothetical protein
MPLRVMPSIKLIPVSLNDKTGALKNTAAATPPEPEFVDAELIVLEPAFVETDPSALEAEPPQALNKKTETINTVDRIGE